MHPTALWERRQRVHGASGALGGCAFHLRPFGYNANSGPAGANAATPRCLLSYIPPGSATAGRAGQASECSNSS